MKRKLPLKRLSPLAGAGLTVPLAALETLLALYIQPGALTELLRYLWTQPYLAFLNFLPFWLLTLFFWFLWSDPFYAAACMGGLGGLLSLVNRTTVEKRNEPLTPKDFALIREAGDAVGSYGMNFHIPSILAILGFVVLMILLGKCLRGERFFRKRWKNITLAVSGAAVCMGIMVGCIQGVYSSKELYNSFPVHNPYYIAGVFRQLGFPYCFCYNFNAYLIDRPEGYDQRTAQGYGAEHPVPEGSPNNVNVLFVMDEAFTDLTDFPAFDYPEEEDPLRFYHTLIREENSLAGHIVVSNFGGGTANTEFDVVTGMQTTLIRKGGTSAFRVLNRDLESIFRVYLADGYQTEFIHPGDDWFYNRQNVYRYFGAEKLLFSQAFQDAERKGTWVTDHAVFETIRSEFETAAATGDPWFCYTVTIQNHMAYSANKYGDYACPRAPLAGDLEETVSPGAHTRLNVYIEGVRDADAMLEEMVTYFRQRQEPLVLVFFGDHLPNLGDDYLCYREIGMPIGDDSGLETALKTYSTPYVIWMNDPAAEALDFARTRETLELPDDNTISANYLGALLLELTGRKDSSSFFSYLCDLRRRLPVFRNDTGRTGDGTYFTEIPEELADDVKKLHYWEYFKLTN